MCVAGGEGTTGKSVVAAALARLLSQRGRTLLVDADLAAGDAHRLLGVEPERSLLDVASGGARLAEAVEPCGSQLDLIASASGAPIGRDLSRLERNRVARGLREAECDYDFAVVDSPTGVAADTLELAASCDVVLLVTHDQRPAMMGAYSFFKALHHTQVVPMLVVNRATDVEGARVVEERIHGVCRRFLGETPGLGGWLPEDPAVAASVAAGTPVVAHSPMSAVSRRLRILSVRTLEELARRAPRGVGRRLTQRWGGPPPEHEVELADRIEAPGPVETPGPIEAGRPGEGPVEKGDPIRSAERLEATDRLGPETRG